MDNNGISGIQEEDSKIPDTVRVALNYESIYHKSTIDNIPHTTTTIHRYENVNEDLNEKDDAGHNNFNVVQMIYAFFDLTKQ